MAWGESWPLCLCTKDPKCSAPARTPSGNQRLLPEAAEKSQVSTAFLGTWRRVGGWGGGVAAGPLQPFLVCNDMSSLEGGGAVPLPSWQALFSPPPQALKQGP